MRVKKIVSGGQTGVDRAALDFALERGITCGGWCPKGRLAEDGTIAERYPLKETPTSEYAERTLWNVRDSDATLVLTWGPPTEGTAFTVEAAHAFNKPCLVVDLAEPWDSGEVENWLERHAARVLNIAGPRASKTAAIYDHALDFLNQLFPPTKRG